MITELSDLRGCTVLYCPTQNFQVLCKIITFREVYGRTDFLLQPCAGNGQIWVSLGKCMTFYDKEGKVMGNWDKMDNWVKF